MAENPCDATITPTTSTTAITEVSLINADLENGTVTPGDETTPTENTTSSEEVSTTTMVEPMYQSYPCRPSPGYNDLRLDFGNGTILEYNITKPLPNTYFSYPPCKKTKPPTGSNSSTTSVEIPSTTSTVSTSSTTSTTSSTTSSSTATTSTTSKITIEDDTASTSSSLGTTITRPTKEPKVQKTSSTSLGTEATGTSGTRATDSSFGTSETSTTAPNEDSETTGTTPFVKSSTDIHEESGSTETNWIETESETTSKESTWIDRRRDSSGKGDGDQSATLTTATGTGISNTTTDGKTAGTTSTTPGPNGTVSTTLPPLPTVTETESKTSTSSAPPLTGTNSTTSTTSTTTTPGHSSPTSNTATVTESTKVSSASNGTTPITGTSEGAGSTGVTTESGSDESGSTGTETTWTPHSTDSNDDGTFPTHLPSHDSTPKEGKNKTSPSSTTTTGHSTGTTSPGHGNVTGSTVTPAANATSPSSTTSTSMNAVSSTTSPVDVTETGSPSPDSSSNSPDPSSSSNPSSTVPGNVSTTLPSQNTTSGSSPVPGSSPSSSPSNASPSSSPASVPASTSPLTSNSSSTTPGVQNATNVPTMTKQPTSTSSGPTAPPGSAGKILWETAVSYPNCSVLLTSTLAYSNGTKANVTKWVDIGCGRRWETTVSNNMINQEGAIVVSQVGQAYDDCTVDVSQLFKYASDCTTLEPENSSPTSTGSASTTPSPIAGKEKILGTSARAFPNCTVVITTTVQYPNKTIANTSKSVDQKCGGSFDTGVKDVILSDGTKIRSERGTVYDNCTLLIQQELEYVNGTQGTKDNWLGDPCVPTTSSPSTTAIPSTTPTAHPSEPSGTTQEGPATTPKIIKVTAKIIGVKATSLPNCTVVITQTMQYSNGTIEDIVKTVDQKCGGNFTVDYSDQNLTLPDGGRLLSSTGSSYGNCSLAVTNKIQYPNNTMTNPTTWYNDSCDAMTSEASTTGLPTSKPIASTNSGTTSTNPAQTPAQSPGATTVPPKVDTSSGTPSSSPTSALSSASTGSVGSDSLSSTTSGSTPTPSTAIPQCSLNSFLNDSANTILVNGTNMTHTCKSGYTFPDGAPMKMSECVNGVWKGQTNATCQPNSCPPLTINLKNARIPQGQDSVMTSQQPIGTMVVHSCSARHVFPSGEPMRIYDCVAGGIWKGKINSDECQHVEL